MKAHDYQLFQYILKSNTKSTDEMNFCLSKYMYMEQFFQNSTLPCIRLGRNGGMLQYKQTDEYGTIDVNIGIEFLLPSVNVHIRGDAIRPKTAIVKLVINTLNQFIDDLNANVKNIKVPKKDVVLNKDEWITIYIEDGNIKYEFSSSRKPLSEEDLIPLHFESVTDLDEDSIIMFDE